MAQVLGSAVYIISVSDAQISAYNQTLGHNLNPEEVVILDQEEEHWFHESGAGKAT